MASRLRCGAQKRQHTRDDVGSGPSRRPGPRAGYMARPRGGPRGRCGPWTCNATDASSSARAPGHRRTAVRRTEMGRNRRRIDESPDKRRDRRDPHSLLPAGYMNARSGSILAVKRAASTSESPGCSRGAASAWAIPRRCLRSAICVAWPEAWDHCGTEQMVVSMRKFDCTVWRSAWKTSRG